MQEDACKGYQHGAASSELCAPWELWRRGGDDSDGAVRP
jgi:hypothetical protein